MTTDPVLAWLHDLRDEGVVIWSSPEALIARRRFEIDRPPPDGDPVVVWLLAAADAQGAEGDPYGAAHTYDLVERRRAELNAPRRSSDG